MVIMHAVRCFCWSNVYGDKAFSVGYVVFFFFLRFMKKGELAVILIAFFNLCRCLCSVFCVSFPWCHGLVCDL